MKHVSNIQRDVTLRLITIMNQMIATKHVKNKKAFAEAIRYPYYSFLRLEKNENTSISLDAIYYSCVVLGINPFYLLTGTGELYNKGKFQSQSNPQSKLTLKLNNRLDVKI